ncbi:MAG: hypothetical protein ABSD74_07910 [Rhizomicrobium sp.]|jgi:hypothetical protein
MQSSIRCLAALAIVAVPMTVAHAGPPFVTDDPEPTDFGHFEIYLYSDGRVSGNTKTAPELGLEVNYGALPDLQISASLPVGFSAPTRAGMQIDVSDAEFGAKYRFIEEDADGWRPQISFYPSVETALGNSGANGQAATTEFLPLWAQKSFGDWTTFGGGGYRIDPGRDARDSWFEGWALLRRLGDQFQLGAELFRESAEARGAKDTAGFNVGALYDLNDAFHLVGSTGLNGTGGAPSYYLALEWTT